MTTNFNLALSAITIFALCSAGIIRIAHADESDIKVINKNYIIKLGSSRIIYHEESEGESISVFNPQAQPVLIAPKFFAEDRTSKGDYLATPPVFLLQSNQSGQVNFIRTNHNYPRDKESLNWACVKSIPPKQDYNENKKTAKESSLTVNKTAKICVQVKFRPSGIPTPSHIKAESMTWKKQGNNLIASNMTPYYISLKQLVDINADLNDKNTLVAPYAHVKIAIKNFSGKSVSWRFVNDLGGVSEILTSPLN